MTIDLAGTSALVIDNDVESVRILRAALEAYGVRVMAANSSEEAKSLLDAISPDIIIAELLLERETGLDFVRWLRSRVADSNIPAIGVTSSHEHFSREDAEAAGFTMFLRKPVNPMELVIAVALLTHW